MLELINSLAKCHEIKLTYKSSRHLVFQQKHAEDEIRVTIPFMIPQEIP